MQSVDISYKAMDMLAKFYKQHSLEDKELSHITSKLLEYIISMSEKSEDIRDNILGTFSDEEEEYFKYGLCKSEPVSIEKYKELSQVDRSLVSIK